MYKVAKRILVGVMVVVLLGVVLDLVGPWRSYLRSGRDSSHSLARVVMITTTQACHCGLQRCGEVRKDLDQMLEQVGGGITLEVIDYAVDTEGAERMMEKFDVYMVPIVLLLNEDGEAVFGSEWDLDEEGLRSQLKYPTE